MHHKYHTEGIILGSVNRGETGKTFFVFTRDLGLLYAGATGIRKMSSKLRYVLQDFSYIKLDFIKGKEFWRITSASKTNKLEEIIKQKDKLKVFAHLALLLRRLLPEQETNQILFEEVIEGLAILEKVKEKEEINNVEIIIVLRILSNLGYVGGVDYFDNFIKSPFENELIFEISKNKSKIISEINKALKETHL